MDVIALAQQGIPTRWRPSARRPARNTSSACSAWYRASCSVSTAARPGARRPSAPWSRCCRTCRTASAVRFLFLPEGRDPDSLVRRGARMPSAHASPSRPSRWRSTLPATDAGGRPRHPGRQGPPGDPRRAAAGEDSRNNLRLLMRQRLSEITGLSGENIGQLANKPAAVHGPRSERRLGRRLFRRQRLLRKRASHAPFDAAPGHVERNRASWNKDKKPWDGKSGMARRSGTKAAAATSKAPQRTPSAWSPPPSTPCAPCCIIRSWP